jgi:hypothetical protein
MLEDVPCSNDDVGRVAVRRLQGILCRCGSSAAEVMAVLPLLGAAAVAVICCWRLRCQRLQSSACFGSLLPCTAAWDGGVAG